MAGSRASSANMTSTSFYSTLGPIVRLEGISINQLPFSGKGIQPSNVSPSDKFQDGSGTVAVPSPSQFLTNVLSEAAPFIDTVAPKNGDTPKWKWKAGPKRFEHSDAEVILYERKVPAKELEKIEGMARVEKDEMWFCRRSVHRDASEKGTASWAEFVHAFKENHPQSEDAFTPAVIGAREAIHWDTTGQTIDAHGKWVSTSLRVVEMKHKIPSPMKNRVFPVVQVTAELESQDEFLVVSIPITDFEKSPWSEHTRDKSVIVAAYVSVERVRKLETGEIEWIMATASDARGVLPQWVQNLATPSAVAKDVDMFLAWIPEQRERTSTDAPASPAADGAGPPAPAPAAEASSPPQIPHPNNNVDEATMTDIHLEPKAPDREMTA